MTYDRPGGKVLYHTAYNPYFKHNTSLWSATDFIAQLTQFIPPWGVRYVHYYGLYSSRCKARWKSLPHVAPVAPVGWKDSHADQPLVDDAHSATRTVPQHACRSAWARLIAKVYEVDLVGGSWPRSGQREPSDLPLVWIRDEADRGDHGSCPGSKDPAPPYQDRQSAAGTRSRLPGLKTCTTPVPATAGTMPSDKELLSTVADPAGFHESTEGRPSSKCRPGYFDHARWGATRPLADALILPGALRQEIRKLICLSLATAGARLFSGDDRGSLEPGKAADLFMVDARELELAGALHGPANLLARTGRDRTIESDQGQRKSRAA